MILCSAQPAERSAATTCGLVGWALDFPHEHVNAYDVNVGHNKIRMRAGETRVGPHQGHGTRTIVTVRSERMSTFCPVTCAGTTNLAGLVFTLRGLYSAPGECLSARRVQAAEAQSLLRPRTGRLPPGERHSDKRSLALVSPRVFGGGPVHALTAEPADDGFPTLSTGKTSRMDTLLVIAVIVVVVVAILAVVAAKKRGARGNEVHRHEAQERRDLAMVSELEADRRTAEAEERAARAEARNHRGRAREDGRSEPPNSGRRPQRSGRRNRSRQLTLLYGVWPRAPGQETVSRKGWRPLRLTVSPAQTRSHRRNVTGGRDEAPSTGRAGLGGRHTQGQGL